MNIYVSVLNKEYEEVSDGIKFNNLKNAVSHLNDGDIIYLENESYYGKIEIVNNDIKIYGKDKTVITYDAYNSLEVRHIDNIVGRATYGTNKSASVTIKGNNFYAYNVTFENSHKKEPIKNGEQAVAVKVDGDNAKFVECKFKSKQDTLYIDGLITSRFLRCYIEGDVDFIFGSANAIFDNCDIYTFKVLDRYSYITAPSTLKDNEFGFLFYQCKFFSDDNKTYVMRPWFPSSSSLERNPRACFVDCNFDGKYQLEMIKMNEYDDETKATLVMENCLVNGKFENIGKLEEKYKKFI